MISAASLGSFLLTSLLIELTPGPNMTYLAMLSATSGRRAGYFATMGIALGLALLGLAAAIGLAALISASHLLYEVLRWGGILYLLWLAYDGAQADTGSDEGNLGVADDDHVFFRRGLITNLLNPKAGVFYIAVLPPFIDDRNSVITQTVVLTAVYVAVATAVHASVVTLAGAARPLLDDPARSLAVRKVMSAALIAVAIWFAISTAR